MDGEVEEESDAHKDIRNAIKTCLLKYMYRVVQKRSTPFTNYICIDRP